MMAMVVANCCLVLGSGIQAPLASPSPLRIFAHWAIGATDIRNKDGEDES